MKLTFVPASHDHGWYFQDASGRVVIAQAQPVPLGVAQELAASLAGGWMPWAGGEIPPEAAGQRIDLEMRDGEIWLNQSADGCEWGHFAEDADIVLWRPTRSKKWSFDANGWHDIEAFPPMGAINESEFATDSEVNRIREKWGVQSAPTATTWPDERRADRDPTAVQGGVVAHDVGGCAPPVLFDRPVNFGTKICNGILLGIGAISAALALACIGAGFPPAAALLFIASGMYAVNSATA